MYASALESFRIDFAEKIALLPATEYEEYQYAIDCMPERELMLLAGDLREQRQAMDESMLVCAP